MNVNNFHSKVFTAQGEFHSALPSNGVDGRVASSARACLQSYAPFPQSLGQRIWNVLNKYFNLREILQGFLYALTVQSGSLKHWSSSRLSPKHQLFEKIGGEHVQIQTERGETVDCHYFDAGAVMQKLEELGGKRVRIEVDPEKVVNPLETKRVRIEIEGQFSIEAEEWLPPGNQEDPQTKKTARQIADRLGKTFVENQSTGKFYLLDHGMNQRLTEQGVNLFLENILVSDLPGSEPPQLIEPFSCFRFDSPEAFPLLQQLNIEESGWKIFSNGKNVYLVRRQDYGKLDTMSLLGKDETYPMIETEFSQELSSEPRGTVIQSLTQLGVYESFPESILTFALEGMNVCVYNYPGKGFSTGLPSKKNINASIEAVYQYVSREKKIPDIKILARGECFGGAPTAWLGREHPEIHLMMDQTPARFEEAVKTILNAEAKEMMDSESLVRRLIGRFVYDNLLIQGIAQAIVKGFDVPEDIKHNRGQKLFNVAVPNSKGEGGDDVALPRHTQELIDASSGEGATMKYAFMPGAEHCESDWWDFSESRESLIQFLNRHGLREEFFPKNP